MCGISTMCIICTLCKICTMCIICTMCGISTMCIICTLCKICTMCRVCTMPKICTMCKIYTMCKICTCVEYVPCPKFVTCAKFVPCAKFVACAKFAPSAKLYQVSVFWKDLEAVGRRVSHFLIKWKLQTFFCLIFLLGLSWPLEAIYGRLGKWERPRQTALPRPETSRHPTKTVVNQELETPFLLFLQMCHAVRQLENKRRTVHVIYFQMYVLLIK